MDPIDELLTRGVANIIPGRKELEKVLHSGKKLNVYLGIDPTATHVHLGHAVGLRKLQALVELGHQVTFLIGDFTAIVGDSSDKESERPILNDSEIEANWQTYRSQAEKILDFSRVTLRHNNEWLGKLNFKEALRIIQKYSLNDYLSRELMKKKLEKGVNIRLDEVLYPMMQGYDSYFLDTDIQIGGADQTFNMQSGRILQKKLRDKESFVLVIAYLTGTDGRKMSKSWGNAIWLDDEASDMFGKVMAVRDDLIEEYFTLATNLPLSTIHSLLSATPHPMDQKKKLAWQIVSELHSPAAADAAQSHFEKTFQAGELPADIPTIKVKSPNILDALVESRLASSKSDARRLIEQGGVTVNGEKISNLKFQISNLDVVRVGPRKFAKISL